MWVYVYKMYVELSTHDSLLTRLSITLRLRVTERKTKQNKTKREKISYFFFKFTFFSLHPFFLLPRTHTLILLSNLSLALYYMPMLMWYVFVYMNELL